MFHNIIERMPLLEIFETSIHQSSVIMGNEYTSEQSSVPRHFFYEGYFRDDEGSFWIYEGLGIIISKV